MDDLTGGDKPIDIDPLAFARRACFDGAFTLGALQFPQEGAVDGIYIESRGMGDIASPCPGSHSSHRAAVALCIWFCFQPTAF